MPTKGGFTTYQENADHVEDKRNKRVKEQHAVASLDNVLPLELGTLAENNNHKVHDCADGGVVVETDEGIHAKTLRAEHDLDHDKTHSFRDGTTHLKHETQPRKLNLSQTSKSNAKHDEHDVCERGAVGLRDAPDPRGDEHANGTRRLEHLDEGDREVEVDDIRKDEGARVEDADGEDGADVHAPREGEGVAGVEEGRRAGEELGCYGCEDEVPCCEDDG